MFASPPDTINNLTLFSFQNDVTVPSQLKNYSETAPIWGTSDKGL